MGISVSELRAAGLGDRFEAIEDAVGDHLEGTNANVAVVSEPFAGRDVMLDYAEEFLGAATRRIAFDRVVRGDLPDLDTHEVILVDNCQYLYTREVGGFDALDRFLEAVARSDALFVTSWNRYAWEYLATVREVHHYFPTRIEIPSLDADQVGDLLTATYGPDLPEFVETDEAGRVKTIGFDTYSIPLWGDWTLDVPVPALNMEYVTFRFVDDVEDDTRAVVFQKIETLSEGDPGVATALWERSVRDGEVAPAYVEEVDEQLDLDHEAAFVLEIVLSKERISREQLDRITETEPIDEPLQRLRQQGVVIIETVEEGEEDTATLGDVEGQDVVAGDGPLESTEAVAGDEALEAPDVIEEEVVDDSDEAVGTGSRELEANGGDPGTREVVRIVPERLHASVRHLRGRQLIW